MKLKGTTLVLLVLALGLGSFVYFHEVKGSSKREEAKAKQKQIFSFAKDDIQSFTIKNPQETLQFERQNSSGKASLSVWQMKKPINAIANDASVSFLLNLLVDAKSDRTLTIPGNRLSEYGLNKPQSTVEIKLKNQEIHQLILGKPNFNNSFLYAQTNSKNQANQDVSVFLVPLDFQYAVKRPLSEWQEKPETKKDPSPKKSDKKDATSTEKNLQ